MKYATLAARILLGLGFTVFGFNILHPFLPQPTFAPGSPEMQFFALFGPTHWITVVGVFQLVGGLLVLAGYVPLGLALLAPVLVNILLFHLCIQGGAGIAPGAVFSVLELFLLYVYRAAFAPLFTARAP